MMTTKKKCGMAGRRLLVVALFSILLTACGPPGRREVLEGRDLLRTGNFEEAIAPLKRAAQILSAAPPSSQSKVWNLLGVAYHGARQFDSASAAYTRALRLDRDNLAADYNLGCLRLDQGNVQGALDYLKTYVMLRPKDANGFLRLGMAQCRLALATTGVQRNAMMESARRDLETAAKLAPTSQAQNALGIIELYRKNPGVDSFNTAAGCFQAALKHDPDFWPALLNIAILQQRYLNQPGQALRTYRRFLEVAPNTPQAREVARIIQQLDLQTKITITPEARTNPANPSPERPLLSGNPPIARSKSSSVPPPAKSSEVAAVSIPHGEQPPTLAPEPAAPPAAVTPEPEPSPAISNQNTLPEAEAVAPSSAPPPPRKTFAQKINPLRWFAPEPKTTGSASASPNPEPAVVQRGARYLYPPRVTLIPGNRAEAARWMEQGSQARQQGRLPEAVSAFAQAVKADPTDYEANEALGLSALDNRNYSLALEALNRALILQNDSANARYAFAWTLQRRGYYEDAAHELDKLLAAHPEEVRGHLLLAKLCAERLNQPKLAREHYARALNLDPQNPQAAAIRLWLDQNR